MINIVYKNIFNKLLYTANHNIQIYTDASKTHACIGLVVIHQDTIISI
jgi:hypothetical protein